MHSPYEILSRKRAGLTLGEAEVRAVVAGAINGRWTDAQLAAFLMAAAIQGLGEEETRWLTVAMLESGDQWHLDSDIPELADKHSTGGVGDKISLVLAPVLAACDIPIMMLTGRALGHTAGTADKLEAIPGLGLELDRPRCLALLREHRMAIGVATARIAPADRRIYRLRDQTATVDSFPLITASILSKKLASGAGALVFDVKTGGGAFMAEMQDATRLAEMLVRVTRASGRRASALITDMSQPLGSWVGHLAEVRAALDCLSGEGAPEELAVTLALADELVSLLGVDRTRNDLENVIASGRARETFERWAAAQGADVGWLARPDLELAPHEVIVEAPQSGVLAAVDTRQLGTLMVRAGAGRLEVGDEIDYRVALRYEVRLGDRVEAGQEMARLYLRAADERLERDFGRCFRVSDRGEAVDLIRHRVG